MSRFFDELLESVQEMDEILRKQKQRKLETEIGDPVEKQPTRSNESMQTATDGRASGIPGPGNPGPG